MSHRARAARARELFIRIFPGALRESKRAQPRKPTTWPCSRRNPSAVYPNHTSIRWKATVRERLPVAHGSSVLHSCTCLS